MHKTLDEIIRHYPLISDQVSRDDVAFALKNLEQALEQTNDGAIVEFGCYMGTTSLFIRRLLDRAGQSTVREFHVYDSFEGLPPKRAQDMSAAGVDFKAGELTASKKDFVQAFRKVGLQLPTIHKGWFDQLNPDDVPARIAFAFLDGDFYDSILSSLKLVWPRMVAGGIVLIDDYQREALPGVERAIRDFFQGKAQPSMAVNHNIARLEMPRHA